jgi:hypothetical protein
MNKKQQEYKKIQSFAVLVALCTMLAMPIIAVASANTVPTLTVVPTSNINVITVIGNGFNANETVYLALANQTTGVVVYNFTESVYTNSIGVFVKDVILPPATYGTYIIYAKTSAVTASTAYTITNPATPKITVSPANSNIIKVAGSGFGPIEGVVFTLTDTAASASSSPYSFAISSAVYNFTDFGVTDNLGNFTVTLIVPTSISGNYTLMAQTRTGITANTAITVPDLTGPKGDTGDTGDRGAKGSTGPAGEAADSTMVYVAIIISVIAAAISIFALLKDRETDEE